MKKLEILKKNRKYFAVTVDGYKCKLVIDENSQDMEPGVYDNIPLEDVSVRTKYGTDVIYALVGSAADHMGGICTLKSQLFNTRMVERCHELSGKWDREIGVWVFSDLVEDQVEELEEYYCGELIPVEITIKRTIIGDRDPVYIDGYRIATAMGRDSGAKLDANVSMISGCITSGGSMKNWTTVIKPDSVIRMKLPILIVNDMIEYQSKSDDIDYFVTKL